MSSRPPQPMSEGESAPGLEGQPPVLDTAQDVGSAGPQTAVDMAEAPISAAVLLPLLRRLKIEVEHGALARACDQVQRQMTQAVPVERVHQILNEAKIKTVQPAQLQWRRFDQRKLPVLLFHEQKWQLAERGEPGQVLLTDSQNQQSRHEDEPLQDAVVLWLRTPSREYEDAFALKGNIAGRLIWRAMFKEREWVVSVLLATLMINSLSIATSLFAMQVYDRVVPTLAYATLWTLVMGMGIVFALDWLLKMIRARILDSASSAVDKQVSQEVYDHIMHLRIDQYPRSLGTLAAQVGGLDAVRQFLSSGIIFALIDMPFALLFIAAIALIGGPISWVYLLLLPVALLLGLVTQYRLRSLQNEQMIRSNERQGLLVDSVRGVESIRSNNATWRFSEEWQLATASIAGYSVRQKAVHSFATSSNGVIANMAYVSAIVVGVGLIETGSLTVGGLIACTILGGRVIGPISQGVQHLARWQAVSQALKMVNQVLLLETERGQDQSLLVPERPPETLELEKVSFSYPDSPIRQLNVPALKLKRGDRVMLLGAVGCGKSTLLKVLAGLYKPGSGRVRLGDADLWEIDPQVVSTHLSYLPQTVHLFKGTLSSNLALSGAVSDSRRIHVAKVLGIDAIAADSPQGMEREISEGGEGLSVGQRQLVGLGRVFVAKPRIWLLDEPTAALDRESEQAVLQALEAELEPEDILVFSTHRPNLVSNLATRIVFMERGEILLDGRPEEVISRLTAKPKRQASPAPEAAQDSEPPQTSRPKAGPGTDDFF